MDRHTNRSYYFFFISIWLKGFKKKINLVEIFKSDHIEATDIEALNFTLNVILRCYWIERTFGFCTELKRVLRK